MSSHKHNYQHGRSGPNTSSQIGDFARMDSAYPRLDYGHRIADTPNTQLFSDEDIRNRGFEEYRNGLRRRRVFMSSLTRVNTNDAVYSFTSDSPEFKNVRGIKAVFAGMTYDVPGTAVYSCFILLESGDLDSDGTAATGPGNRKYHWILPVTQPVGAEDPVTFVTTFPSAYIIEFMQPRVIKKGIKVTVMKEATTGLLTPFDDVTDFKLELEIICVDKLFRYDVDLI